MQVGKYTFVPILKRDDFPDWHKPGLLILELKFLKYVEVMGVASLYNAYLKLERNVGPAVLSRVLEGETMLDNINVYCWTAPYKGYRPLKAKREVLDLLYDRLLSDQRRGSVELLRRETLEFAASHRKRMLM